MDVVWTFHGTAIVASYREALAWLERMCGCTALEYSEAGPPVSRNGGCSWIGDNLLELVEPNDPEAPPGRYLTRYGPGFYNLALQVADLRQASEWLAARGAAPTMPPDRGFTFTRPSATCGLQFEWADLRSAWDPRFGGRVPPPSVPPRIDVARIAHWGALVADPGAAVRRMRELWNPEVLPMPASGNAGEPAAALSLCDGVMTIYVLGSAESEATLWGTRVGRPHFHLMALRVRNLSETRKVLSEEGVRVIREYGRTLVTHPEDTCGLGLAWTDEDIPGDPRGPLRA